MRRRHVPWSEAWRTLLGMTCVFTGAIGVLGTEMARRIRPELYTTNELALLYAGAGVVFVGGFYLFVRGVFWPSTTCGAAVAVAIPCQKPKGHEGTHSA
jgi:CHASE2 domain-containing sensor protein